MSQIPGTKKFIASTAAGATAIATQAAPGSGYRIFVTDIAASSDSANALLEVIEDIATTPLTVLFRTRIGKGGASTPVNFAYSFKTPIQVTANKSVSVQINGVTATEANVVGFITKH